MSTNQQQISRTAQRHDFYRRRVAEQSRQRVAQFLHDLHALVHRVESHDSKLTEAKQNRETLHRDNDEEAKLTLHQKTTLLAVLAGFLGVYGLDYLLARAAADWLIGMGFYHLTPGLNNILLMLVPACFIAIEIAISEHAMEARDDIHITGHRGPWIFWTIVSLVLAIVMPALGVATYLVKVNLTLHGQPLSTAHQIQLLGLCCLSLVAHVCMLFGGELSRNARTFLWFSIRDRRLQSLNKQHQAAYLRARGSVSRSYRDYLDGLETHNTSYPDAVIAAGPFEKGVVRIVNELYENAIQQPTTQSSPAPEQPGNNEPLTDPEPIPTVAPPSRRADPEPAAAAYAAAGQSNGHHQFDDDYLRRIVESQIRNNEGEVSN